MTTRRRDKIITRKISTFRFDVELHKKFSEYAKSLGLNCTEALEILMKKTLEGPFAKTVTETEAGESK